MLQRVSVTVVEAVGVTVIGAVCECIVEHCREQGSVCVTVKAELDNSQHALRARWRLNVLATPEIISGMEPMLTS